MRNQYHYICANLELPDVPLSFRSQGILVDTLDLPLTEGDTVMCTDIYANELWIEVEGIHGRSISGEVYENCGSEVVSIGDHIQVDHKYVAKVFHNH